MSQTDAMLLEHWVRERNADAFKLLATRYAAMVYHTCRRILGNPTEAEDVTQECFVILASTDKPIGGYLAPWLHRVAYNRSLARLRAENRRREREVRYASEQPAARDMAWDEIGGYVDAAIAELPDKLRVPVVAYFLDGQTHEGIAHALGIPRSTVTYRVDKGVECLRRTLKGKGVTVAGTVLAGAIKANAAATVVPSSVVANLGKLALSGVGKAALPAAWTAAPLLQGASGFLGAKTISAAVAGLAVVVFAGWQAVRSVSTPPVQRQPAVARAATPAPSPPPETPPPSPVKAVAAVAPQTDQNAQPAQTPVPVQTEHQAGAAPPRPGVVVTISNTVVDTWRALRNVLSGENNARETCANNLKQISLAFKMFSNEAPGQYLPMPRTTPGTMIFANSYAGLNPVCPEYLTDKRLLVCPADGASMALLEKPGVELLDHASYYYIGYAVTTQEQLEAFAAVFRERRGAGLAYNEDLDTPQGKIYRLREGVERFFITDLNNPASAAMMQSEIPVLIESPHHNDPMGGNVLFLDGHVEYIRYSPNGKFPMIEEAMNILRALSGEKGSSAAGR